MLQSALNAPADYGGFVLPVAIRARANCLHFKVTMVHQSAAVRELIRSGSGVFMVLFTVLMTTQAIRLLGQAAGGKITPDAVMALLGFAALGYLPVILAVTVFMAVLLTFSRWYKDSEMVIWQSAGMPLTAWFGPVFRFALPIIVLIALLSFFLTPWATGQSKSIRQKLDQRDDVALISPGAFNESSSADRVFFVEAAGDDGKVRNVFVNQTIQGRTSIVATESGHTETTPEGEQFLILERGRRYELPTLDSVFRVMQFERYGVRIGTREVETTKVSIHALPLAELFALGTRAAWAELQWRIGVPVSAIILAMLAVPLSYVNPRAGRASNLLLALLVYAIYSNFLGVSEAWVAQGRISFWVGVWVVHALMLVVLAALLWVRMNVTLWPRRAR
jgi:lipopolysaccharide export system permease protein